MKPFDRVVKLPSGCWEWQGTCNRGYGHVRHDGRRIYVHRLAWERTFGPPCGKFDGYGC